MLSTDEIAQALLHYGFHCPPQSELKVRRFEHERVGEPVFLKQSAGIRDTTPLVLHPNSETEMGELLSTEGVQRSSGYVHNSNLRGYPKRLHRGRREIEYGIGIGFPDSATLTTFLDTMLRVPPPAAVEQPHLHDPVCGTGGFLIHAIEILGDACTPSVSPLSASIQRANQMFGTLRDAREDVAVTETERRALNKVRIGQGTYRTQLFSFWGGCAVTGCSNLAMLRASHAKPWHVSSPAERLDPFNGLLLVPNLDQAFDQGLISFDDVGAILISTALDSQTATLLGITPNLRLRQMTSALLPYLAWHRDNLFRI
jgi:putative restriction endonuclease